VTPEVDRGLQRWLLVWVVVGIVILAVTAFFLISILGSLRAVDAGLERAGRATVGAEKNVKPLPIDLKKVEQTLGKLETALEPAPGEAQDMSESLTAIESSLVSVESSLDSTSSTLSSTAGLLDETAGALTSASATLGTISGTLSSTTNPLGQLADTLQSTESPLIAIDDDLDQTEGEIQKVGQFVKNIEGQIEKKIRSLAGRSKSKIVCDLPVFGGPSGECPG
jgi:methyl-accepting chemotaxis protein